jgi:hypothetical protein
MGRNEAKCKNVDWIYLAQHKDQLWALESLSYMKGWEILDQLSD